MRTTILSIAAALAVATPALANEARVEARGGAIWDGGTTEGIAGIALGYDWDLGQNTFAGLEVSGDKILTSGTKVAFGITGRAGIKAGEAGKLFAATGYTTETCTGCEDAWHLGAGYQHSFGGNIYGKVEYRHYFVGNGFSDPDAVTAGLGIKF